MIATLVGGTIAGTVDIGAAALILLQWVMSIIIAAIYTAVTDALSALKRRWIIGGVTGGVVIFLVMNYIVVPLSAWHRQPHFTALLFSENLAAMLIFGLIVAYCTRTAMVLIRHKSGPP